MKNAAFIFMIALLLVSCDSQENKPANKAVQTPANKAVLMVTWLVPGQPLQTSQTVMSDAATCEKGRQAAVAAGETARDERQKMNERDKAEAQADIQQAAEVARAQGGILSGISPEDTRKLRGEPLPQVSAYCVQQ